MQDIDGFSGDFAVAGLVNVGEDGKSGRFGEAAEDFGAFDNPGTAEAVDRGPVRLVVGGLEDVGNAEVSGSALD